MVMRNILLAELCGTRIHCQHLSSAGSVRLLRNARGRGVAITGELCPHHIALTDKTITSFDANYKMTPPLRAQEDIEALIEGVAAAARERGADRLYWHTQESNARARVLYDKVARFTGFIRYAYPL